MRLALVLGTILLIAGVAGRAIVPEHRPHQVRKLVKPDRGDRCADGASPIYGFNIEGGLCAVDVRAGLAQTSYDGLRVAYAAALIVGAILALFGLSISVSRRRPA